MIVHEEYSAVLYSMNTFFSLFSHGYHLFHSQCNWTGVLAEGIREAGEAERVEASDEKKNEFKQLLENLREMYMYLLVNPGRAYDMTKWCGVMKNAFGEPIDVRRQEVC